MRKIMSLLAVAALSILLSACFSSEQPKFPASSAVAAFGTGGRYVVFEHVGSGKFRKQRMVTVKPMLDGSYEFVGEKTVLPISFHDIGNGIIVGQAKPDDNKHAYGYLILTRKGNECSSTCRNATSRMRPCCPRTASSIATNTNARSTR